MELFQQCDLPTSHLPLWSQSDVLHVKVASDSYIIPRWSKWREKTTFRRKSLCYHELNNFLMGVWLCKLFFSYDLVTFPAIYHFHNVGGICFSASHLLMTDSEDRWSRMDRWNTDNSAFFTGDIASKLKINSLWLVSMAETCHWSQCSRWNSWQTDCQSFQAANQSTSTIASEFPCLFCRDCS